jgi:hypothetical protein
MTVVDTRWKDQPTDIIGAELLSDWYASPFSYAVYKKDETYYLTTGNLFGSQTVASNDVDAIFRLIKQIYEVGDTGREIKLPNDVKLLEASS